LPALPFEAAPARRLEHLALRERARRHARRAGAAQPEPRRARASLRRGSGPPGEGHGLDPDLQHQGDRRHARLRQGLRRPPGGVLPSPREGVAGSLTFALRRLLLAVPVLLGVVFIVRPNSSFDALARLGSLFGLSMPVFWTGLVLIVLFSLWLPWLPVGGRGSLAHLVLPAVALALPSIAMLARLTRSSVLEVLHEDYVRTARAKGLQ